MKRFFLVIIVLGVLAWVGAYVFYRYYFPDMMARAIVSNETPQYIPRRLMNKVDELRAPVNKGADEIVREHFKNGSHASKKYPDTHLLLWKDADHKKYVLQTKDQD